MAKKEAQDQEELSTYHMKKQVEDFLMLTIDARITSEKCRDYYDSKQWTSDEVAKLASRQQAPIVVNRVKPKVDGLKGLVAVRLSDPKAYPRTKKHEKSAEAITDGLRYVADMNDFQETKMACAEDFFVEGYTGVIVDTEENPRGETDICIHQIPWDRIYFDPHSRKKDFSDARYMGIILWMDEDEIEEKFPDAPELTYMSSAPEDQTFADRPRWSERVTKRRRVAHHFYKEDGVWMMCIFSGDTFLTEPQPSPYEDEFGQPTNPIELISAYVDRDNNRYSEVLSFLDQQDEINHRRSKALHLLSQRQTAGRAGTIKDIAAMKRELAKPDGHVEWVGEKADFQILQTSDMARGQFELYQDAKNELDAVSYNAQLAGERQGSDLSGVAINKLQQAGTIELNSLFVLLNGWEKRVYRHIWCRMKQFWTAEKWIRVTDDQDTLRWVGLNAQITAQVWLEDLINDPATPLLKRRQAAAAYQHLMQTQDPNLERIVDIRNKPAELDMDIILDQSFDTINVQQEQFALLMQFAQASPDIDIVELIQLSQLRGKDELIAKIEERRKAAAEAAGQTADTANQMAAVKMRETNAKASKHEQDAIKTHVENSLLVSGQAQVTSVSV